MWWTATGTKSVEVSVGMGDTDGELPVVDVSKLVLRSTVDALLIVELVRDTIESAEVSVEASR
jgi:hypothetical protein